MKELQLIQKFEPVFIEAANLARKLKKVATKTDKLSSDIADVDIVTSADLEVQEFILKKLAISELIRCELVAEEDTKSKKLFSKKSKYVITLDPIDGTRNYAEGKNNYSFIIGLHNKERPIYTFDYYPELNWGLKIVNNKSIFIGNMPRINESRHPKAITTYLNVTAPQKTIPSLYKKLTSNGYRFVNKRSVTEEFGATGQFILDLVDGHYVENGSAVDCLVGLHFALANNYKVYNKIDLSRIYKNEIGIDSYKGYCLILRG